MGLCETMSEFLDETLGKCQRIAGLGLCQKTLNLKSGPVPTGSAAMILQYWSSPPERGVPHWIFPGRFLLGIRRHSMRDLQCLRSAHSNLGHSE